MSVAICSFAPTPAPKVAEEAIQSEVVLIPREKDVRQIASPLLVAISQGIV